MKRKIIKSFSVLLVLIIITSLRTSKYYANNFDIREFQGESCTNFSYSFDDTVLFGNSEDASGDHPLVKNPEGSYIFVYPNSSAGFGCVFLGWYWQDIYVSVQGGMNEEGLCYDSTAVPDLPMNPHPEKPYKMGEDWLSGKILRECSNVDEAIEMVTTFEFESLWFQLFLTDSSGDSAIISPGLNGEIVVTRQEATNGYLSQTNFNRVHPESHYGEYPCSRNERAETFLNKIETEENLTIAYFEEILDAVHIEKFNGHTAYSNICDPKNKMMYIYFFSQFNEVISFNVTEELDRGERGIKISSLLSEETVKNGLDLYNKLQTKYKLIISAASIGAVLTISCMIGIPIYIRKIRKRKKRLV